MAKVLTDRTAERMLTTINTVEGMQSQVQSRLRRRVRSSGGGGAQRPYIKITTSTDVNNYIADVITPTDATKLVEDVTVKALEPDAGQKLPVGREMFADIVDGIYYIQPAVAYGS